MQNSTDARVDGVSGLLLHHFKPQSFEEFRAATEFKQRRQNEMRQRLRQRRGKGEKVHKAQAVPDARWMNNTWSWIHEHTNGATHASMLLRVPELCRAHTRFAASLRDCGLQARPPMHPPPPPARPASARLCSIRYWPLSILRQDLCVDCRALQERHGCVRQEASAAVTAADAHTAAIALHRLPSVDVMGSKAAFVAEVLQGAGLSAQLIDGSQLTQAIDSHNGWAGERHLGQLDNGDGPLKATASVVQTDSEDREAVCAAYCERTLFVDPKLVADNATIVSLVKSWTGSPHWPHPFA
jgi:hypothetical protein